jgi:hypothetical protein
LEQSGASVLTLSSNPDTGNIAEFTGLGVNALFCATACLGVGGTIDPSAQNGINSSSSWTIAGGEGIDLSVDLLSVSDYVFYAGPEKAGLHTPFLNREFVQTVPLVGPLLRQWFFP